MEVTADYGRYTVDFAMFQGNASGSSATFPGDQCQRGPPIIIVALVVLGAWHTAFRPIISFGLDVCTISCFVCVWRGAYSERYVPRTLFFV